MSNTLLSADGIDDVSPELNKLLEPGSNIASFKNASRPFSRKLKGCAIVASNYKLAGTEHELMIKYLFQEDGERDDGRCRLANVLLCEEVANTFDVALIDAPPRLTAVTINGFCAATHLLVPTVYDKMSSEAVATFLDGIKVLKTALNQEIELLGVVGMLTAQQPALSPREQNARNVAAHQVSQVWSPNCHFSDRHIPRKEAIAKAAGDEVAYYCDGIVKSLFDELGGEISRRLWPPSVSTLRARARQALRSSPTPPAE